MRSGAVWGRVWRATRSTVTRSSGKATARCWSISTYPQKPLGCARCKGEAGDQVSDATGVAADADQSAKAGPVCDCSAGAGLGEGQCQRDGERQTCCSDDEQE